MRKLLFVPLGALAFGLACGDSVREPLAPVTGGGRLAPTAGGPMRDDISNNLDASIDAVAEAMPLNVGGASGSTQLYVTPRNGDGDNGCNFQGNTEQLTVSVSSSNPSVATVSPSSLTFGSCGDTKALTITPISQGSATISVSQTANNTGGSFNLAPASFTVVVAPPANTAPGLSITGVTPGTSYTKGTVLAPTCQVTDAEDGNTSFPATLTSISGPYAADGIGTQTASCSYTDAGALTASASVEYSFVDPSAPDISGTLNPPAPDGDNGWYKSDVTLQWTVTDNESPLSLGNVGAKTGCVDQSITQDQVEKTYSCSATSAGGSAGPVSFSIKRDATAPAVTNSVSSTSQLGSNGWYVSDVTVTFTASDLLSGLADPSQASTSVTTVGEGSDVQVSGPSVADNAGNVTPATTLSYKVDKTSPAVSLVAGPANGASYYFGSVPSEPTCSASDELSGLDGSCSVTGYSSAVGTHTVTATANDKAGNTASATATYTVKAWTLKGFYQPVDMSPVSGPAVYNTVKAGSTVPLKFNVYAATELTNTSAILPFSASKLVSCDASASEDAIEILSTGGTSLRYDSTAGQFIQNWQTPKTLGCYKVIITTQDGSALSALFKLK